MKRVARSRRIGGDEIAQIVHDLKNPLSTIALELCMLEYKLAAMETDDARRSLARITQNVVFMDRLVHDLLDLELIDSGGLEIQRRATELRTLLEDVVDRCVPSVHKSRVFVEPAEPVTLAVDDLRIQRVVANLLQNALKYSPPSAGVIVRLERDDDRARVSVIDAGPGLSADQAARLFEKFQRAPDVRSIEGTGLGLYVSRMIIEAHGGRIGVDTVRGSGSRFYFELPRDARSLGPVRDRRYP